MVLGGRTFEIFSESPDATEKREDCSNGVVLVEEGKGAKCRRPLFLRQADHRGRSGTSKNVCLLWEKLHRLPIGGVGYFGFDLHLDGFCPQVCGGRGNTGTIHTFPCLMLRLMSNANMRLTCPRTRSIFGLPSAYCAVPLPFCSEDSRSSMRK